MPILKQAKKALRGSKHKRVTNDRVRKQMRADLKVLKSTIEAGKKKEAVIMLPSVQKSLDKAVKAGAMKQNTVARTKSRLSRMIKNLG